MSNISARILRLAAERGDRVAFRMQKEDGSGYRSVSWANYHDHSLRIASFLRAKGVGPGDRVLLISENCPEWTMVAVATLSLGATLVPVASIASAVEVENILKGAKPKFSILSIRSSSAKNINAALLGNFLYWDTHDVNPIEDICQKHKPDTLDPAAAKLDDVAVLIYTSGTTGQPKAVPLTHKNILSNAEDILVAVSASDKDRCVSILPLSHMFEFTGGFLVPTLVGASVTYCKSLRADDLLQSMRDTKATILLGVPLLFEIMARSLEDRIRSMPEFLQKMFASFSVFVRANRRLGPILFYPIHRAMGGHIRYFMAGGSRLQPHVFEFFRGIGIQVLQGYGLTETSPVLSVTTPITAAPDNVGQALPSVEIGIFSDEHKRLGVGEEGEIWARGPNIFKGYLDPAHNKEVFFEDWFRTGDLGTLDEHSILRITGRKKDIIVTGAGKNVYPEEIEAAFVATGFFMEAAVLGLVGEDGHEKVCVAVVPDRAKFAKDLNASKKEDVEASAKHLVIETSRELSDYKRPQQVEVFFEELPKTITRKVKKHEVRALIKKRMAELGDSKQPDTNKLTDAYLRMDDVLERTVAAKISSVTRMPQQEILRSASLTRDLGLDSLLIVEVVGGVEQKYEHQFEGVDFSKVDTVADLLGILGTALGDKRKPSRWKKVWLAEFNPWDNYRWYWRWPRTGINQALRLWLRGYYQMRTEGLENIQDEHMSYVFTPNHSSHFDTLSIMAALPEHLVHKTFPVAAKDYFFNKWWRCIISRTLINCIPFDRKLRVDEGMQKCHEVLSGRGSLLIFPEGTRSPDGKLQEFKAGVGQLVAAQHRVRAIPTYIEGAHAILPKGSGIPHPLGTLRVRFGKPMCFSHLPHSKDSYRTIARELQNEVDKMSRGEA